jgi:hypothetical protein
MRQHGHCVRGGDREGPGVEAQPLGGEENARRHLGWSIGVWKEHHRQGDSGAFPEAIEVLFFDSIGVPSTEAMITEYGSVEGWQRAKTSEWLQRLVPLSSSGRRVILEGQMRLSFLSEGASAAGLPSYMPILIDCDDATRVRRLIVDRQQPELASDDMMKWAAYLRAEALHVECDVLDTSMMSIEEAVSYVAQRSLSALS